MDIISYYSIIFTTFIFSLLFLVHFKHKCATTNPNLIPGPPKLPIIGNLHQLAGTLIHRAFRDLSHVYGPIMHLQLGEVSTVVVSSAEAAMEVMKTHDVNFATRPRIVAADIMIYGSADLLFAPYGPYWRQLRKIFVMKLLSAKQVQSFYSVRNDEVSKIIYSINLRSSLTMPVNLTELLHGLTNDITARTAFGSKCDDKETYLSAMAEALKFGLGFSAADLFPSSSLLRRLSRIDVKLGKCFQKVDSVIESIIHEHKRSKTDGGQNLLDVLLRAQEEGSTEFPLTTTTIKAIIFDVFQAGTGSVASTLNWAMSELVKNPRVMRKAQEEVRAAINQEKEEPGLSISQNMNYLKMVVKEALRLHPPAPLLVPRVCTQACKVQEYEISEKTRVLINAWAIGRSPKYWTDPEVFMPERFEENDVDFKGAHFEFIPFGAGRRMCPGISFSLATIETALAKLLYHFDWSLPAGELPEKMDMTETKGLAARRKNSLILYPKPYVPIALPSATSKIR